MQQKCFIHIFYLNTQNKDVIQGSRLNKINNFYCFTKDILKWNWHFFLNFKCEWSRTQRLLVSFIATDLTDSCYGMNSFTYIAFLHH